ncbi:MAG TPA: hypothetical protein VGB84_10320 [Arachidicoccus sp.]
MANSKNGIFLLQVPLNVPVKQQTLHEAANGLSSIEKQAFKRRKRKPVKILTV